MATIAKVTRRDAHQAPIERGVEHATGWQFRTRCGIDYSGRDNLDWYYFGEPLDFFCEPLTSEVTCKRCLRAMAKDGEWA